MTEQGETVDDGTARAAGVGWDCEGVGFARWFCCGIAVIVILVGRLVVVVVVVLVGLFIVEGCVLAERVVLWRFGQEGDCLADLREG